MVESQGFVGIIPCEAQQQQHKCRVFNWTLEVPEMKALIDEGNGNTADVDDDDDDDQGASSSVHMKPRKVRRLTLSPDFVQEKLHSFRALFCLSAYNEDGTGNGDIFPGLEDNNIALACLARASRSDYGCLASSSRRFRSLVQSGELYTIRRKLGFVEHWIYMLCNLDRWEAFDPGRQRWMRLPPMPSDECFPYADKESLAVGTELLVFGREMYGLVVYRYSILNHQWYRGPPMNLPRCMFASASHKEIAIVAGGCDSAGDVLKSAELYNSEMGTWETLPEMHSPRKHCSGFFMDGKFYVIGGMMNNNDSLTSAEEFDLETRTWRMIPDMFPKNDGAAYAPPLVAVVNNQLYAVDYSENEIIKYNKDTNRWSPLGMPPLRTEPTHGWGLAFKACGETLIVIGGHRGRDGEFIEIKSWKPSQEGGPPEWKLMATKQRVGGFVYNCAVMGC